VAEPIIDDLYPESDRPKLVGTTVRCNADIVRVTIILEMISKNIRDVA